MTVDISKLKPASPEQPTKKRIGLDGACVQCGYCCYMFWCVVGCLMHGDPRDDGPCPSLLQDDDGIHYCGAVLKYEGTPEGEEIKRVLDTGGGCGSTSFAMLDAIVNGRLKLNL